jgi:hypothetical protein
LDSIIPYVGKEHAYPERKETSITKTINDFTEPTEAQLREKVYTLEQISVSDVWLAAFLGSTVAQQVVGVPNLHLALLDMQPMQIGEILKIYDTKDKAVTKRLALILAKALLPKWKARFPGDPLGDQVMVSIVNAVRCEGSKQVMNNLCDKICYGEYGSATPISGALGKLLRVANGYELYLGDIWPSFETDVQLFVAMIGRNLVPWLLDRVEIQVN